MAILTNTRLINLHQASSRSNVSLKNSNIVGCFSCTSIYSVQDINEYVNLGQTALCPYCSIDAVVPLDDFQPVQYKEVLEELNTHFFQD